MKQLGIAATPDIVLQVIDSHAPEKSQYEKERSSKSHSAIEVPPVKPSSGSSNQTAASMFESYNQRLQDSRHEKPCGSCGEIAVHTACAFCYKLLCATCEDPHYEKCNVCMT